MKTRWLTIILFFSCAWTQAQTGFSVNTVSGCVPLTVTVTANPGVTGASYNFDTAGCGPSIENCLIPTPPASDTLNYTYASPGTYVIGQLVGPVYGSFTTITVRDTPVTELLLNPCLGRQLLLNLTDPNYQAFHIDFGDGTESDTFFTGDTTLTKIYAAQGEQEITVTGLYVPELCGNSTKFEVVIPDTLPLPTTDSLLMDSNGVVRVVGSFPPNYFFYLLEDDGSGNFVVVDSIRGNGGRREVQVSERDPSLSYCYQWEVRSVCGNSAFSPTFCTLRSPVVRQVDQRLEIQYEASSTETYGNLCLLRNPLSTWALDDKSGVVLDSALSCNAIYDYRLEGQLLLGDIDVVGPRSSIRFVRIFNPPSLNALVAGYDEQATSEVRVVVEVPQNSGFETLVVGSGGEGDSAMSNEILTDIGDENGCLSVFYLDSCLNRSMGMNEVCPLNLSATVDDDNYVILEWGGYSGSAAIDDLRLLTFDLSGNLLATIPLSTTEGNYIDSSSYQNQTFLRYRIEYVSPALNAGAMFSNLVTAEKSPKLLIPTAFSPNGDGLNDELKMLRVAYPSVTWFVYNKWGQLIFQSNSASDGWDGTINGQNAPEGVYLVAVEAKSENGEIVQEQTSVVLIR